MAKKKKPISRPIEKTEKPISRPIEKDIPAARHPWEPKTHPNQVVKWN